MNSVNLATVAKMFGQRSTRVDGFGRERKTAIFYYENRLGLVLGRVLFQVILTLEKPHVTSLLFKAKSRSKGEDSVLSMQKFFRHSHALFAKRVYRIGLS